MSLKSEPTVTSSRLPSGVHDGQFPSATRRGSPVPSAARIQTLGAPCQSTTYAIDPPSGDHDGAPSKAGSSVSWVRCRSPAVVSASMSQMSPFVAPSSITNASRVPSGDQAGNSSMAGRSVSRTRSAPSVPTLQMSPAVGAFAASNSTRAKATRPSGGSAGDGSGLAGSGVPDGAGVGAPQPDRPPSPSTAATRIATDLTSRRPRG